KSGVGVAGGASVNFIRDTTLSYVNTKGTATMGKVALDAENSQTLVTVTGGVALSFAGKTGGGGGSSIGGAFSLNQLTANTRSFIKGLTSLTATATQGTGDEFSLTATRGGVLVSVSAALAGNTNSQGNSF